VIGQGEVGLGLGPVGPEEAGASGIVTAPDGQGQVEDAVEGGDRAEVLVAGLGPLLTFGAVQSDGDQVQGAIGFGAGSSSFAHGGPPGGLPPFYVPGLS